MCVPPKLLTYKRNRLLCIGVYALRVSTRRPTWLAADAAGAARELAVFISAVACRRSRRSRKLPAAPLKPSVGRAIIAPAAG
jgi:hypothetical protein